MRILIGKLRHGFVFFLLAAYFLFSGCATLGMYNPATGRREFIMIPTESEVAMGKNLHQDILKEYGPADNKAESQQLERIGERLVKVCDRQDYTYHFYLLDKDEMNAFTTPGGNIYVFSGLQKKLNSDDEMAAVLAHEMGHCAARHTIKKFQAALGYNLISALLLSRTQMSDQAKASATLASNIAMGLATSAYSRKDEYEADRLAVKYMYLAGYDPDGMIKTLEVLKKEAKGPQMPLILRTHPYTDDRIAEAKKEIQAAPLKYGQSRN